MHKSCLPGLPQGETSNLICVYVLCVCSVVMVFWTGSRRGVSELCNHPERSSLSFPVLIFTAMLSALQNVKPSRRQTNRVTGVFGVFDKTVFGFDRFEVESFARKAPITETNLDRLERRIQSRAQGKAWKQRAAENAARSEERRNKSYFYIVLPTQSLHIVFTACSDW